MLDEDGAASKGCDEINLSVVEKIIVPTSEAGVGLLLNHEHNISRNNAWCLVSLAAELNLCAALDATVNMDVKNLPIDDSLLAAATLAAILVLEDLSLSIAVRAHRLEPLNHGAHLPHHRLHAVAIAASAPPDRSLLSSTAIALRADDGALQSQLRDLASINIFERDVVGVMDCLGLCRCALRVHAAEHAAEATSEAAAAKELGKKILGRHATATSAAFETGLTILVVDLSLFGV